MNNAEKVKTMLDRRTHLMGQLKNLSDIRTIVGSCSSDKTFGIFAGYQTQVRADVDKALLQDVTADIIKVHTVELSEIDKRIEAMAMLSVV